MQVILGYSFFAISCVCIHVSAEFRNGHRFRRIRRPSSRRIQDSDRQIFLVDNIFPSSAASATPPRENTNFKVFWNTPSFQCHPFGNTFSHVSEWGILQNERDNFRGDQIALLYDPGLFPALLEANGDGGHVKRNGGVPQEGNITRHLDAFVEQVENKLIPDYAFSGLGVIDFEHWRPIWDENFGYLNNYRTESRKIEKSRRPYLSDRDIEQMASRRFESSSFEYMKKTLDLAKKLRPLAKWGYYGFPLCFNYTPKNNQPKCSASVMRNNDRVKWLFEESGAIYPSLYLKQEGMSENSRYLFMKGRLREAIRVSQSVRGSTPPVYAYIWLRYFDTKQLLSKNDLVNTLALPKIEGAAGVIIWGASNDVNTRKKCAQLDAYIETVLGPAVKIVQQTPSQDLHTLITKTAEKPSIFNDDLLTNEIYRN